MHDAKIRKNIVQNHQSMIYAMFRNKDDDKSGILVKVLLVSKKRTMTQQPYNETTMAYFRSYWYG